ncbi:relaxase domain-containing protein [Xanthomonas hortorum]|uniref:relaxase domain-containing protein n=1 Tax=Xanthomonas hortorum TaxID=56454 RepID=UPI002115ADE3|nr:relaxase domain-containing protein [Xanthomonas hortorum]UUF04802.1 relaxase domain-containing protein [Xanthomonas hortorum pv. pelargonii]UXN02077.1 relaxase domain-containing protein [Xanthomonas hortorum pv. pelargonii]
MIDITVITRQSVGKVVSYYADGADDYYAKDGTAMQWQGEGAAALGLEGEVDRKRFGELLDGRIDEHTRTRRIPRPPKLPARSDWPTT